MSRDDQNSNPLVKAYNRTLSIQSENMETWSALTNKSYTVNILLQLAEQFDHPDDVNAFLRELIRERSVVNKKD